MADEPNKFPPAEDETEMDFDESTPLPQREVSDTKTKAEEISEEEATPIPTGLNIGTLRDRVASALFDLFLLGYLYVATALGYNFLVWREMFRPIPFGGNHGLIFHSLFGLLLFLYFFISEGVFFTSPGKFLARLSVRDPFGRPASLLSIAIRNFLRPIDLILGIFPLWLLLEKSSNQQRLGDLLAGTIVMKHLGRAPQRIPVTGYTASGSLRLLTGMFDLVLAIAWIGGFLLWIDHDRPVLSLLVIGLIPIAYFFWHMMWEGWFQTTFGLWLGGLKIVGEDGTPIGFSQAFLRALFRLFDTNPAGWATLFLSQKNQRPSDLAAATVVVHTKRSWNTLVAMGISLALLAGVWSIGFANPHNFFTPFFKLDFLKTIFTIRVGGLERQGPSLERSRGLFVKKLTFLEEDRSTPRANSVFKPGERVFFSFDVVGFTVRDHEAWIQEDLTVRYPDHTIGFKKENIVDFHQRLKKPDQPLEIVNTLVLPADAKAGNYTLVIVLTDKLANQKLTEQRLFQVTP